MKGMRVVRVTKTAQKSGIQRVAIAKRRFIDNLNGRIRYDNSKRYF